MVYCSKCGTQNPDSAKICSNCGAPLYEVGKQYPGSEREHYRRMENECFGLPNGGMIVGLIIGVIIIVVGLGLLFNFNFWTFFWPLIVIVFGILILVGALFGRRRRYSRTS